MSLWDALRTAARSLAANRVRSFLTALGVVMNHQSIKLLQKDFFPVVHSTPGLQSGPFSGILARAESDPQGLFNALLSPAALSKIPVELQQVILPPLKTALSDSLHLVFLVAMGIMTLGVLASLGLGSERVVSTDAKLPGARGGLQANGPAVRGGRKIRIR